MPGYFGTKGVVALTHPVSIEGGFTVLVRRLNKLQKTECDAILRGGEKLSTRVTSKSDGKTISGLEQETITRTEVDAYKTAVLTRGIQSWDLTDDDGTIAPVDAAHVGMMLDGDTDAIFVAINDFNKPLDEKTKGESVGLP